MRRTRFALFAAAVVLVSVGMYGCSTSTPPAVPAASAEVSTTNTDSHTNHDEHAGHANNGDTEMSDMAKMKEQLAKLPEADRAAAERQHFCPVSGEMLGAMGTPIKVTVKGQDVWLCCPGCKDKLVNNPDEYLAKLKK